MTDEIATAIHESAHGVVGIVVGVPDIQQITLMPRERQTHARGACVTGGRVLTLDEIEEAIINKPEILTVEHIRGSLAANLVYSVSGVIADRKYLHRRTKAMFADSGWQDGLEAGQLLAAAYGCKPYGGRTQWILERVIVPAAIRLVDQHWKWITRTAAALVVRRQLTRAEIVALRTEQR